MLKHLKQTLFLAYLATLGVLPVRAAVMIEYRRKLGGWPDIDNPRTFNEKIQWRKIHGDHATYARLADKIAVKAHVREVLGEAFVIPTLWEGKELPDRNARDWPAPFVVKANHGSGMNQFVFNTQAFDWSKVEKSCRKWMRKPYRKYLGERFYSAIERKILVEPLIADNPIDYKFYVFDGRAEYIHVDTGRFLQHKRCFFDRNWTRLPFSLEYPIEDREIPCPPHLGEMIAAAEKLGAGLDFVRIDFYDLPDGPKFGEMTFAPGSGYELFNPLEYDSTLGSHWHPKTA